MDTTAKIPFSERFNLRMLAFIAIIGVLVGYPVWVMIDAQVSGGIKNVAGGYKQVDLKAMSTFAFDQANGTINDVPARWRALDGQKIIVEGEMWSPNMSGPDVDYFELVYSIAKCCVTSAPQVQHFVHARPVKGASLPYVDGRVSVQGILHVNVKQEEGRVVSVYQLDVESIKPAG